MSGSCENYGTPNGTACACPPGFGGSTCSQPACGGTIFQGSARSLANGSPFANLTSSSCSCEDGWTGTGCNVCQTAKACQSGFASVRGSAGSLTGADTGQNNTIVCNAAPRVYAAGEMSCDVQVSLITSAFDLQSRPGRRYRFAIVGEVRIYAHISRFSSRCGTFSFHVVPTVAFPYDNRRETPVGHCNDFGIDRRGLSHECEHIVLHFICSARG